MVAPVSTVKSKTLARLGRSVKFVHRDRMRLRKDRAGRRAMLPALIPSTTLPVDGTNNAAVACPMDGNDSYGDCMEAMACHVDNIWTFGMGKPGWQESQFSQASIINQYLAASGGDNGLDEGTLLDQCWKPGLAGQPAASYVDSLDIDVTNTQLAYFAIDNFFAVELMWSVPDQFINDFHTGAIFDAPGRPDPANGHGTPLADIDAQGRFRLWTWGTWCWCSPAFIASVDPAAFVVFSARQFGKDGYDAKGRHITSQASLWAQMGGNPIPAAVINAFPPPSPTPLPPAPPPGPTPPVPPSPTPPSGVVVFASDTPAGQYALVPLTADQVKFLAESKLTPAQWIQLVEAVLAIIMQFFPPAPTPPTPAVR